MTVAHDAPISSVPTPTQVAPFRLSPALVDGVKIWVECPNFCVEDHVASSVKHLADLDHGGEMVDVTLTDLDGEVQLLAHVQVSCEPGSSNPELRKPHLYVADGGGFDAFVPLDGADAFADGLVAVAQKVRAMVRAAR
ncbi:DUF6907 domain-containing protein [Streptomyces microflavus]|uniref:DUF6907 domain-containing protein n=1 Tax=Streptomyces microflavus TaxID=1919 RepID=UPI002E35E27A|nr:hypothetical protein [Streptomyces microflavus]